MEELKIEDYKNDLNKLCEKCNRAQKCKDKDAICLGKKLLWNLGKKLYKRKVKKGEINGNC